MSEEQLSDRLTRLEERFISLREDFQSRVSSLEGNQARIAWIVVGGVITALLSLVVMGGR